MIIMGSFRLRQGARKQFAEGRGIVLKLCEPKLSFYFSIIKFLAPVSTRAYGAGINKFLNWIKKET